MVSAPGHVLVGGGTGFVGTRLCSLLRSKGYGVTIISRMPGLQRITWHDIRNKGLPESTTAVVNLAGQNALDPTRRWTEGFKQNVVNSRVNTTQTLADSIISAKEKPKSFITMSGVGIYKPSSTTEYTEESHVEHFDFLSKLAIDWENAAKLPPEIPTRQVITRCGVVLGREGGMVQQLFLPFYLGVGGPVGSGKQYLPWIHVEDIARLILFAIENDNVKGVLNAVAPDIITNKQFSDAFAKALWRPAFFPVPEFVLNAVFNEERAKIMTQGQKVLPKRTQEIGFKYTYPDIQSACKEFARL